MATEINIAGPQQAPVNIAGPEGVARQRDLDSRLQQVKKRFPAFTNIPAVIQSGSGEGYVEYYPPWEGRNPNPGKVTLEMRPLSANADSDFLNKMIAGDLMHYIGGTDEAGKPYDPKFYSLKKQFEQESTPIQLRLNRQRYQDDLTNNRINPNLTFDEYQDMSGVDAWMRGRLFPDPNVPVEDALHPSHFHEVYSPKQRQLLQKMQKYLEGK
jgi:hypothetical protein